jgi:hypothetical protein
MYIRQFLTTVNEDLQLDAINLIIVTCNATFYFSA